MQIYSMPSSSKEKNLCSGTKWCSSAEGAWLEGQAEPGSTWQRGELLLGVLL